MKKALKIIILLVLIIAVIAVAWLIPDDSTDNPDPVIPSPTATTETSKVTIEAVPLKMKTDNMNVDCVYPKIKSFKDKEFENYINEAIALEIMEYYNEILFIIDEETPATSLYSYVTTFDKNLCGKYLSLVINQDYQTGGIRSNTWKDIYNINIETERIFYLDELFEVGVDYQTAIISEITDQAAKRDYELMGGNGLTKLPTKQKFYIKDEKLFIYFDPSEAAANVFGELHFEMPFTMNEDGYFEI